MEARAVMPETRSLATGEMAALELGEVFIIRVLHRLRIALSPAMERSAAWPGARALDHLPARTEPLDRVAELTWRMEPAPSFSKTPSWPIRAAARTPLPLPTSPARPILPTPRTSFTRQTSSQDKSHLLGPTSPPAGPIRP